MSEIFRVLKVGGKALLQVPVSLLNATTQEDLSITSAKERIKLFGQADHVRLYGQDYPQRLEKVGFKVEKVKLAQQFKKYGLSPDEDLFIAAKT